ncbi:MAG: PAS domain S-box protein [Pseudomonadota bacterium]|nr:PAS domain S-box protein [Pseudomonadota bacterium]
MRKKILIVDNCPVTLLLLTHLLQKEDYELETAEDGLAAIEIMDQFKPDIMIIDLVMPNITGDKLCQIIRKKPEFDDVLLVILSAIAAEEEIDFISFGADACIAKGPSQDMIKNILTVFKYAENKNRAVLSQKIFGLENVYARQVTKELLASKKNFEITLQNMADGFVALTASGTIVSVNSVAIDFFKIPEDKLISTSFFDHFETKQKNLIIDRFNKITTSTIEIGEHSPIIRHGKHLLIKMVPVFDDESKSIIVLIDDITKRKLAEQELHEHRIHLEEIVGQRTAELEVLNENLEHEILVRRKTQDELIQASRQWSNTFNTISDFITVINKEMKMVRVNKALCDFTGKDAEELIGQPCYEIMHGTKEPWPGCPHVEAMESGKTTTSEINDPHIGKPLLVTCSPFFNENGDLVGTVHVARDISQQKFAEEEKERLIAELQSALSKVKQLSGFLPICASCKKIRDDRRILEPIRIIYP